MKKILSFVMIILILSLSSCDRTIPDPDDEFIRTPMTPEELSDCPVPTLDNGYQIVWADEFNLDGEPDPKKWSYDLGVGNGGWGNQEAQFYTKRPENVFVKDGVLTIRALKENYSGSDYTSARIVSREKGDWLYGRIEVRAKLPEGVGTWPAIWMMPTDSKYGIWPKSGEIDIMEAVGRNPNSVLGTLHMEAYNGGNGRGRTIPLSNTSTEFHTYSMEWTPNQIKIFADEILVTTWNNPKYSENNYKYWPFDQRFYLIMNIAMGGTLGKTIDPNFQSAEMQIDYVRVYQNDYTGTDNEKPSVVELSSWHSGSNSIQLSWEKATDNLAVSHYEIVLDGKQIGATIANQYRIEGLQSDKVYQVRIIAVDIAGNYSITNKISVQTVGIQSVPGTIQAEYNHDVFNGTLLTTENDSKALLLSKTTAGAGYVVLAFNCQEPGSYKIELLASVPRANSEINVYSVNADGVGTPGQAISLTPTWGSYATISLPNTYTFQSGINYLKIETNSQLQGDIIAIDCLEVDKA